MSVQPFNSVIQLIFGKIIIFGIICLELTSINRTDPHSTAPEFYAKLTPWWESDPLATKGFDSLSFRTVSTENNRGKPGRSICTPAKRLLGTGPQQADFTGFRQGENRKNRKP